MNTNRSDTYYASITIVFTIFAMIVSYILTTLFLNVVAPQWYEWKTERRVMMQQYMEQQNE